MLQRFWILIVATLSLVLVAPLANAGDIAANVIGKLNAQEKKNLQVVLHWWHEVYEAHHGELADKYMTETYIQHNPNVPSGRAGFLELMKRMPVFPIRGELYAPPKFVIVKDDYVVMTFEREDDHPREPGKTYIHYWTEIVRVEKGLVAEHWDSAFMRDPGTYNPPIHMPYDRWKKKNPEAAAALEAAK